MGQISTETGRFNSYLHNPSFWNKATTEQSMTLKSYSVITGAFQAVFIQQLKNDLEGLPMDIEKMENVVKSFGFVLEDVQALIDAVMGSEHVS
jgi:hypothetical protein